MCKKNYDKGLLDSLITGDSQVLLSIGQVSEYTGLSVRQVRHYCDNKIIEPSMIDEESGYRYFAVGKISQLILIKEMRALGFSLKKIGQAINNDTYQDIENTFNNQLQQVNKEIEILNNKAIRLKYYLKNYESYICGKESNEKMSIELVKLPERWVITKEKQLDFMNGLIYKESFEELGKAIDKRRLIDKEKIMGLYRKVENPIKPLSITFGIEIGATDEKGNIRYLPEGLYIKMIHKGRYEELYSEAYPVLEKWIKDRGYVRTSDIIEIYHVTRPFTELGVNFVTEVQFEIKIEKK